MDRLNPDSYGDRGVKNRRADIVTACGNNNNNSNTTINNNNNGIMSIK